MLESELRLLAIAGTPQLPGDEFVHRCRAAAAGGVTSLQVRFKGVPAGPILATTELLLDTLTIPVYLNDRADIAIACGAHGVHLGADDLPVDAVRALAPDDFVIGLSVGSADEAQVARRAPPDYWSIGAVYASPTKADAGAPIGVAGLRALIDAAPAATPVVAIGGITADRIEAVVGAGAVGVAVGDALFGARDVEQAARRLRKALDRALG